MTWYRKNGTSYSQAELDEAYEAEQVIAALDGRMIGHMIVYTAHGSPRAIHICQTDACAGRHDTIEKLADKVWGQAQRDHDERTV